MTREDTVWLVKKIFGEEVSKDNDIVDFYQQVNEVAMDEYAELIAIEHLNWVIDTFTTDEGRLPISSNTKLGGKTIFINHEEYPLSHTFQLFLKLKQQSQ